MVWDAHSRRPLALDWDHDAPVRAIAFSHDGQRLYASGRGGTMSVWELCGGLKVDSFGYNLEQVSHAPYDPGSTLALAISPQGEWLAAAGTDGRIRLWRTREASPDTPVHTLVGHAGWVTALAFSPDGKTLATGGRDQAIALWDLATGRRIARSTHPGPIAKLAYQPSGSHLVVGMAAHRPHSEPARGQTGVRIAHLDLKQARATASWELPQADARVLAFIDNGQRVAMIGQDHAVQVYDVSTRRVVATLSGHQGRSQALAAGVAPPMVFAGDAQGQLSAWKLADGKHATLEPSDVSPASLALPQVRVQALHFDEEGQGFLLFDTQNQLWQWPLDQAAPATAIPLIRRDRSFLSASFRPVGHILAVVSNEGLELWNWRERRQFSERIQTIVPLTAVGFSPNGQLLATGNRAGQVHIWRVSPFEQIQTFETEGQPWPTYLGFPTDGSLVFAAGLMTARLGWRDLRSGKQHTETHAPTTPVAISQDGKALAHAVGLSAIAIREPETGKLITLIDSNHLPSTLSSRMRITALSFSPDGQWLIIGCGLPGPHGVEGGQLWFWHRPSSRFRLILPVKGALPQLSDGAVSHLSFSSDGNYVAYVAHGWLVESKVVRLDLRRVPDMQACQQHGS